VENFLGPLVHNTYSYINHSNVFVNLINKEKYESRDMLTSFDVISIFTKIPLNEAIQVINEVEDSETTKMSEVCLRSTYFSFKGEVFEKTSRVAMVSPLPPIVSNLFMEKFDKISLESYPLKLYGWKRYVNYTNIKWPHGKEKQNKFFEHLNGNFEDIKFTMELQENESIPFLDVLIIGKQDGIVGHKFFMKKINT
jgi:hypothetical protein